MSTNKLEKVKHFWEKYEAKIMLFLGLFLVAGISFQFGSLYGRSWQQDPLVIEKASGENTPLGSCVLGESSEVAPAKSSSADKETVEIGEKNKECVFVGSKNSDKYHKPDCQWGKRIKAENKICFNSEEEAKNEGYIACSCVK